MFFIVLLFGESDFVFAGDVEFTLSPNPVGSGARAIGMGGAFIAVADDATAASWNPGGLLQLDTPEISVVGNWFHRIEDNGDDYNENAPGPGFSGKQTFSKENINYLSIVYPFDFFGKNMVIAFNYQHLYNLDRDITSSVKNKETDKEIDYQQDGSLSAIGVAFGIKIKQTIYIGLTLNFWDNAFNKWEGISHEEGLSYTYDESGAREVESFSNHRTWDYSFRGFNANVGVLWHSHDDRLKLGAVFKFPFRADLKGNNEITQTIDNDMTYSPSTPWSGSLDMPISYGFGIAYRLSDDKLTLSADIYKTEWQDFIFTDSEDNKISPITGKNINESTTDSTMQIRLGLEYVFITSKCLIPFRTGIFYDPAPVEEAPDNFWGISLGTGITGGLKNSTDHGYSLDIAFQFRCGDNVNGSMSPYYYPQDVYEWNVYSSLIFYW